MSYTSHVGNAHSSCRPRTVLAAGCLSLLFGVLLAASPALAISDLVYFDQTTGYGFDQSLYGLPVDLTADNYLVAADRGYNPFAGPNGESIELFILLDHQMGGEWIESCVGQGPSCVQRALIDITWQVEINPAYPGVGSAPLDVTLFLASPDRDPLFDGLDVGVRYDPSVFDVIQFPSVDSQGDPYDYHFLGFPLGPLLPGVPNAATVNFQYEIAGLLPVDPGTGAPFGPGIGGGATILGVPEPSTALMVLLGLGGLALLGRSQPREMYRR